MKYDYTASVVFYHTNPEDVKAVLHSFFNDNSGKVYFIVIDHSRNDNLKEICEQYTYLAYYHHPENRGFGAGHNIAIRKIIDESPYHFVLNPDIKFDAKILDVMVDYMEKNQEVGSMMPKIVDEKGNIQYLAKLLPTPMDLFFKRFLPASIARERVNKFMLMHSDYSQIMNVPYLSGCFMALRTKALKEIGLFDERFFMYPEDIDLTRRIHQKYKTLFFPDVQIIHRHEAGSYKSLKLFKIHVINMIQYFNKWGWFIDKERKKINKKVLQQIK